MSISIPRTLPENLREIQLEMEEHARRYGLDFFPTIFEMLDYEELSMFAAYGGFPVRYPHWRFGAQFDELMKGYSYGLQKIYEMVINTDPCYAYLLSCNQLSDQKLVIAHVYGHCDFFKNNQWFAHTNRRMLDQMANHAARIHRSVDRVGFEPVEEFIDACLSLEDLIDIHSMHIRRVPPAVTRPNDRFADESVDDADLPSSRFPSKGYMERYINPPDVLQAEESRLRKQRDKDRAGGWQLPEHPQRDVLLFLLENAPLADWQRDILSIIREEAYYFAPQGQTKIMNEGWASYWHSTIMTRHGLLDSEVIDYADHHSGTMATSPHRLNPYKLGIELFRDIEERWNKGQFGPEYAACDNLRVRQRWDRQLGLGREKIFEVRRIHNDITFIDTFLTPEFCDKFRLFSFQFNSTNQNYEIASRKFQEVKRTLLDSLTNHGRPFIDVTDANYKNRGELYLTHRFQGIELKQDEARDTLLNLYKLWKRPTHIETVIDDHPCLISFDGSVHLTTPL